MGARPRCTGRPRKYTVAMILSSGSADLWNHGSVALPALSAAAYLLALAPWRQDSRWPAPILAIGWLLHGLVLVLDIAGGHELGMRLGFGPVLSLTVWLVLAVHAVECRFVPLPAVRRALALAGMVAVVLAWGFPGDVRLAAASRWAPLHWVLGVASYGLFGAAVLHGALLDAAERQMRAAPGAVTGPLGMPLLRLERLTFSFVQAGFTVLTAAIAMGALTAPRWRWDHKTIFSVLGWIVFAALLLGRHRYGWRGRRATRWLYSGAALLLLGYVGSRFVFEVLLGRAP